MIRKWKASGVSEGSRILLLATGGGGAAMAAAALRNLRRWKLEDI
jgi:hypothetical protein